MSSEGVPEPGADDAAQDVEAIAGRGPCDELLEHLFEFVDSEMSADECERLRDHVRECPTCREATDAETHLRVLLRRSCAEVAPNELRMRVVTQISVLRLRGLTG